MAKSLGWIGVPSSMGAFAPGQERGPIALREADLIGRLSRAGVEVEDYGDGPKIRRWRPDRTNRYAQNLSDVVEVAQETAQRVAEADAAGHLPLILGGDCTIELGTVAALISSEETSEERIGLVYFDVHPDLNVPDSVGEGALDWMGVAHMLGEEGAAQQLSHFGPRFPLLTNESVFMFSCGTEQATEWEREVIERRELKSISVREVADNPVGAAQRALAQMESRFDRLIVHFDVDTVDFTDLPLSENTGRNEGLSFEVATRALETLLRSERPAALTVTEFIPYHGAEDGSTAETLVDGLVAALSVSPVLARRTV
ncbi:MAG: arginase family protein [Rubrobacteraceae bacterium]